MEEVHFEWFLKHLKEQLCLSAVWSGVQQTVVDEATDEWRQYLRACVRAERRHFEHLLQLWDAACPVNIFTLNDWTFHDYCSFLLE